MEWTFEPISLRILSEQYVVSGRNGRKSTAFIKRRRFSHVAYASIGTEVYRAIQRRFYEDAWTVLDSSSTLQWAATPEPSPFKRIKLTGSGFHGYLQASSAFGGTVELLENSHRSLGEIFGSAVNIRLRATFEDGLSVLLIATCFWICHLSFFIYA